MLGTGQHGSRNRGEAASVGSAASVLFSRIFPFLWCAPKGKQASCLLRSTGGAFEGQMPFVFNDPLHWLIQASEAREIAAQMTDLGARADMLTIAEEYDRIAQRAAERLDTIQMARLCEQTGVTIKLSTTRQSHDLPRLCGQAPSASRFWRRRASTY